MCLVHCPSHPTGVDLSPVDPPAPLHPHPVFFSQSEVVFSRHLLPGVHRPVSARGTRCPCNALHRPAWTHSRTSTRPVPSERSRSGPDRTGPVRSDHCDTDLRQFQKKRDQASSSPGQRGRVTPVARSRLESKLDLERNASEICCPYQSLSPTGRQSKKQRRPPLDRRPSIVVDRQSDRQPTPAALIHAKHRVPAAPTRLQFSSSRPVSFVAPPPGPLSLSLCPSQRRTTDGTALVLHLLHIGLQGSHVHLWHPRPWPWILVRVAE